MRLSKNKQSSTPDSIVRFLVFTCAGIVATSCAKYESPTLDWPAQVSSISGFTDTDRESVVGIIDELNQHFDSAPVAIAEAVNNTSAVQAQNSSPTGSVIQIELVDTILPQSSAVTPIGATHDIRVQNLQSATGYRIAGRAELEHGKCHVLIARFVNDTPGQALLIPVLWHELGHCAGLGHVEAVNQIMSPSTGSPARYSAAVLETFFKSFAASIGYVVK